MNRSRITRIVGGLALAALCLPSGCGTGGPNEDALLYAFRGAQIDGQVRRAWPAGQEYVNSVLAASEQLKSEVEALAAWREVGSLWLLEDPRWRDEEAIVARVEELRELIDGQHPQRQTLLRELTEAIDDVPSDLPLGAGGKEAFAAKVWEALALQGSCLGGDPRRILTPLVREARAHLELCRQAAETGGQGETFAMRHAALVRSLGAHRDAYLRYAANGLARCEEGLANVDPRVDRNKHLFLTDFRKFLRDGLQDIPKGLFEEIRGAEREVAALRDELRDAPAEKHMGLEAALAFAELRLKHLEAERAVLKPQVDDILAGGAEGSGGGS